jgi:hypothetical protein
MAAFTWKTDVSGNFNTNGDWNTPGTPGPTDDAILDSAGGAAYTVTSSQNNTVNSIQTAANATLDITVGTFTATAGTGAGVNAGAIDVGNNTFFVVGGALNNSGSISLQSGGNDTRLRISSNTTLSGGGTIALSSNGNNRIDATTTGLTLTNVNNTIEGGGELGYVSAGSAPMTFINQAAGVINANTATVLYLDFAATAVTNAGLIEATSTGGLTVYHSTINNGSAGKIEANGGNVYLQTADIQGGTLKTLSGAIATVDGGSLLDGTASAVNNQGAVDIQNNTYLSVEGAINNTGSINLQSGGNDTRLRIAGSTTLTGAGTIVLSSNGNNRIDASNTGLTLTNVNNTIEGGGSFGFVSAGSDAMTFVNEAAGVVNANTGTTLYLDFAATPVTNAGLLESTSTGGLNIYVSTISNGSAGVIEANGGNVLLQSADIQGGTLETPSGVIETLDRGSLLDGTASTVNNQGAIDIQNNTSLSVQGAIDNTGSFSLQSGGNDTRLRIAANTTLSGAGTIVLSNNGNNRIDASNTGLTLTNVNNTIEGGGELGYVSAGSDLMTFVNQAAGVVNANTGTSLYLDFGKTAVSNLGLLESTSSGGLTVYQSTINNGSYKTGGKIVANGGNVYLTSADIIGGTLNATTVGTFETTDRGSILDGKTAPLLLLGTATVANNTSLTLEGTINLGQTVGKTVTTGTIDLASVGNQTDLVAGVKNAALSKGGFVTLSDNGNNFVVGTLTSTGTGSKIKYKVSSLSNSATISGGGAIGSELILTNTTTGVIDATGANALIVQTGDSRVTNSSIVKNSGLIEATNPGALANTGGLRIVNTTIQAVGTKDAIEANGATTHVDLQGATIKGGNLVTLNGGVIETFGGDRGSLLDGSVAAINNKGVLDILNNAFLSAKGTINNTGTINLQSGGNDTRLRLAGSTTLTGAGTIVLSGNVNNRIDASTTGVTLTNVNNTIEGAGALGYVASGSDTMTFINEAAGVINANTGATLFLDFGSVAVSNAGLIEATASGGLTVYASTVSNGSAGVIEANGGNVNLLSADIQGGTLKSPSGTFEVVDRGSLLDGTSSTVNNQAVIDVENNNFLYLQGAINNTGTINLQSNGNDTRLRIAGNTTLTGAGTIILSANTNNRIDASNTGLTLTNVNNTIEGAGALGYVAGGSDTMTFINEAAGVINANTTATLFLDFGSVAVSNAGLIEATASGGLTVYASTVSNGSAGVIEANGGNVSLLSADIQGGTLKSPSGTFEVVDRGSLLDGTSSTVNNQAVINVENNNFLYIQGTINNTGSINVNSGGNDTRLRVEATGATLEGAGTVTLSNNGNNTFDGVTGAVLTNDSTIQGAGQLGGGSLGITNNGTILANDSNALTINTGGPAITNNGSLAASGGTLFVTQAVTGSGSATIGAGGRIDFEAGFNQNVTFTGAAGASGELDLASSIGGAYSATVSGVQVGDANEVILLNDLTYVNGSTKATYNTATDLLTVTNGTASATFKVLAASGSFSAGSFSTSNVNGHVEVFDPAGANVASFASAAASFGASSAGSSSASVVAAHAHPLAQLAINAA